MDKPTNPPDDWESHPRPVRDRVKTVEPYVPPTPSRRWIQTNSGERFEFMDPRPLTILLEDIAAALSKLCRFTGQCNKFYSVAEHSYRVSLLVPDEDAFAGLMHDASEAYLGDLSTPVKSVCNDYRLLEETVATAIYQRFRLPVELPSSVKDADARICATEARLLYEELDPGWSVWMTGHKAVTDMTRDSIGWTPEVAERMFYDRGRYLWKRYRKTLPPLPVSDRTYAALFQTSQGHIHHVTHGI